MLNDRDDKFEGQEESEYHFSDDEVSYEVETESPKPSATPPGEPKESFVNRLKRSKRVIISAAVFLVLLYVVYKMVAPSSTAPTTQIAPPVTIAQDQVPRTMTPSAPTAAAPATASPEGPVIPVVQPAPVPTVEQQQPVQPTAESMVNQQQAVAPQETVPPPTVVQQPVPTTVVVQPQPLQPVPTEVTSQQQQPTTVATTTTTQPVPTTVETVPAQQQVITTVQTTQPQQGAVAPPPPTVQVAAPPQPAMTVQVAPGQYRTQAEVAQEGAQLINRLQSDYGQKLNDFAQQNKGLQDQVKVLSNKVATIESELNHLIQVLTRQAAPPPPPPPPIEHHEVVLPRVGYTVQAIIPGRAWLKADNGETLTVAEGDIIRGLGRVTKIDPYDGVVEVNTGSKVITLSYGVGG